MQMQNTEVGLFVLDVNTFWAEYKDFMYNQGIDDHIEPLWAFLEEHSRTVIAEDVLDEAREEASEEAYEIGREEGYDNGHDKGYEEGHEEGHKEGYDLGYFEGYQDAKELYE